MPYADELVRVSLRWEGETSATWPGELAVNTFHLHHHHNVANTFDWDVEISHLPTQIHDKLVAHWGGLAVRHPRSVRITQVKAAHLAADGTTLHEGALDISDDSLRGASDNSMLPPEVAACVSSWAYTPGGFASHKGRKRSRFYLPYLASSALQSDGTIDHGVRDAWVALWQSFINDVQGMHTFASTDIVDGPDYWDWAITSFVDASWHNADWVSIDDHFDSQRRRQHQTPALRTVLPLTHS